MSMPELKKPKSLRLGGIYLKPETLKALRSVAEKEQRTMVRQAAYIIEQWANEAKNPQK